MTNTAIATPARHDANLIAKAMRAMTAIEHLVKHSIVPDPDFPTCHDRASGLEWMERALFPDHHAHDHDAGQLAAAMWAAVAIQDQILTRAPKPATFTTSRPYIAMSLRSRIDAERIEDPFAGLVE